MDIRVLEPLSHPVAKGPIQSVFRQVKGCSAVWLFHLIPHYTEAAAVCEACSRIKVRILEPDRPASSINRSGARTPSEPPPKPYRAPNRWGLRYVRKWEPRGRDAGYQRPRSLTQRLRRSCAFPHLFTARCSARLRSNRHVAAITAARPAAVAADTATPRNPSLISPIPLKGIIYLASQCWLVLYWFGTVLVFGCGFPAAAVYRRHPLPPFVLDGFPCSGFCVVGCVVVGVSRPSAALGAGEHCLTLACSLCPTSVTVC